RLSSPPSACASRAPSRACSSSQAPTASTGDCASPGPTWKRWWAPRRRTSRLRREREGVVGPGGVLSEPDELLVYESDGLTLFRALADFVVFPTSAEQVSAVVKIAGREGLPFVARGAGTGLSGGCLPAEGGIVLSLMRMSRVLEVDY